MNLTTWSLPCGHRNLSLCFYALKNIGTYSLATRPCCTFCHTIGGAQHVFETSPLPTSKDCIVRWTTSSWSAWRCQVPIGWIHRANFVVDSCSSGTCSLNFPLFCVQLFKYYGCRFPFFFLALAMHIHATHTLDNVQLQCMTILDLSLSSIFRLGNLSTSLWDCKCLILCSTYKCVFVNTSYLLISLTFQFLGSSFNVVFAFTLLVWMAYEFGCLKSHL